MGLGHFYWRSRALCNVICSGMIGVLASSGYKVGIPNLFRGDFASFVKAAELMLSVGSSLLGFIIAAVTLVYALTADQRFSLLRASNSFSELSAASRAAMFWLLVASVFGALLLLIEPSAFEIARHGLIFVGAFIAAQVTVSTAALTWVIGRLVSLA